MHQQLTIGFSPCPNDTFIFDALINHKIDTEGLEFKVQLEDVETLNEWAFKNKLDISKLSFNAFFRAADKYILLNSGSALGKGCGPLLIGREKLSHDEIPNAKIAIPGENTTANRLLSFAFPKAGKRFPILFSKIEDAVLNKEVDLGLIIHENRFTYQDKGLVNIMDLGEYWEQQTGYPIPLGGITVKRSMELILQQKINRLIKKSLNYAFDHLPKLAQFVRNNSQEMNEKVMRQHIDLYVNNYSLDLGEEGREAVQKMYEMEKDLGTTRHELFMKE